jgi:hypothetical protein
LKVEEQQKAQLKAEEQHPFWAHVYYDNALRNEQSA